MWMRRGICLGDSAEIMGSFALSLHVFVCGVTSKLDGQEIGMLSHSSTTRQKKQAVILQMKHMNSHQEIKKTSKVLISFIFFSEILFLFQFCESQIKATNNKKSPKQTVGTLTCETVFACLF